MRDHFVGEALGLLLTADVCNERLGVSLRLVPTAGRECVGIALRHNQ